MEFKNVEENLRHSFRALACDRPAGDVREIGGVSIASAGTSFQMFNAAFLAGTVTGPEDLERRIVTASVHFRARDLGWSFWVCIDLLPSKLRRLAERLFEKNGLRLTVQLPGMCAERLLPPRRALPQIQVRRVADGPPRLAFCDIGSPLFPGALSPVRRIFPPRRPLPSHFFGFLRYLCPH